MGKCKNQLVMSAVDAPLAGMEGTRPRICSSNLLVWQLSPQEVKGLYVSQRGVGFIHSLIRVSALKCCQWFCCL